MQVTDMVLIKLGLTETTPAVELAVAEAEQIILNYCQIDRVPGELVYVQAALAAALEQDRRDATEANLAGLGAVKSVSMGDTSYSYDNAVATKRSEYLSSLINDHKAVLNRFRRGLFA